MNVKITQPSISVTIGGNKVTTTTGIPVAREYVERPVYTGPTEVTPAAESQTLATAGYRMTQDVVVGAIPQNYGLITWNGSTLTVS